MNTRTSEGEIIATVRSNVQIDGLGITRFATACRN
jgi:hypothetical protein